MIYLAIPFLAFSVTLVAIPVARLVARHLGAVDLPRDLGIHSKPVPRTGGIAIYLGWTVAACGAVLGTDLIQDSTERLPGVILAGSLVLLLGLVDDARGLAPLMKLVGQVAIGLLLLGVGVVIQGGLPLWLGLPLSLLWFVGLMNAFNLLDGMDGLAAGVAVVASASFAVLAAVQGNVLVLVFATALIGSTMAFLRHNLHPAEIFMGDVGSLFLGLHLAILGALLTPAEPTAIWLAAPILVLGVPLLDACGAVVRRLRAGRSVLSGDRRHVYDLLHARGLSRPRAVQAVWAFSGVGGILSIVMVQQPWGILSAPVVIWAIAVAAVGAAKLGLFHYGDPGGSESIRRSPGNENVQTRLPWLTLAGKLKGNGPLGTSDRRRLVRRITLRNRHVFLADLILLPPGAMAAWAIRFDGLGPEFVPYLMPALFFVAFAPLVKLPVLFGAGMYSQAWRYVGRRELMALGWSVLVSSAIIAALMFFLFAPDGLWKLVGEKTVVGFPRNVLLIDALLSLNLLGLTRLAAKVLSVGSQGDPTAVALRNPSAALRRVLLVGAGDAGAAIAAEMRRNPGLGLLPVGFVDDDPRKRGVFVQGIKVLGTRKEIPDLVRESGAEQVLMTMPSSPGHVMRDTVALCRQAGVPCRTVPGIHELIDGSVSVRETRDVRIEDLLRREPVNIDVAAVADYLNGARVLVTGAGGSIGSELCRHIERFSPELLILLGHGENSIYRIQMELRRRRPDLFIVPAIADIRDADRVREVMAQYLPTVVFHAAAHKHVPLMESHASEVITNNVLGTRVLLRAAEKVGAGRFIFVSTDKAADPVNLLGATKRLGEILVCNAAHRSGRAYAAVRFGNVLGSRGSVVPLFLDQIAAGGPVTITHPEVARYFMTIPEAARLIIQAGALSEGGEVFILDMGEPVKIVDLVADLVRLSDLRLGQDIEVVFTGLRPGEKLREILFTEEELATAVRCRGVLVSRLARVVDVDRHVSVLGELARRGDQEAIVAKLREMLAGYQPAQATSHQLSIATRQGQGGGGPVLQSSQSDYRPLTTDHLEAEEA